MTDYPVILLLFFTTYFFSFILICYFFFMDLYVYQFIILSGLLFLIGLWGIIVSRINFIVILMSIELLLFAININFVTFSIYLVDMVGIVIALFILTIAAAESAIGLAILIVYYRVRSVVSLTSVTSLKA